MRYVLLFIALLLLGAGCATTYDGMGCPHGTNVPTYEDTSCPLRYECVQKGGIPGHNFNGSYAGCDFPNN